MFKKIFIWFKCKVFKTHTYALKAINVDGEGKKPWEKWVFRYACIDCGKERDLK